MGANASTPILKPEAAVQARNIIPALKEAIPQMPAEVYTVRIKLQEWASSDSVEGKGSWVDSKGYIEAITPDGIVPKLSARVGTYNIWFDTASNPVARWNAVFDLLFRPEAALDLVALQEVTAKSWQVLQARSDVRKEWLVVDGTEVWKRTKSWYGSILLVRRGFMLEHGIDRVEAHLTLFTSPMQRALVGLEFSSASGVALRIATAHFESGSADIELRRRQFYTSARVLAYPASYSVVEQPPPGFATTVSHFIDGLSTGLATRNVPPAVLLGDTNIESYDELTPLFSTPLSYIDTYATIHPPTSDLDPYRSHPTFFTTYTGVEGASAMREKRIDYILAREGGSKLTVKAAERVGNVPITHNTQVLYDQRGRDGKVYPSDHLGVIVHLEFTLERDEV